MSNFSQVGVNSSNLEKKVECALNVIKTFKTLTIQPCIVGNHLNLLVKCIEVGSNWLWTFDYRIAKFFQ